MTPCPHPNHTFYGHVPVAESLTTFLSRWGLKTAPTQPPPNFQLLISAGMVVDNGELLHHGKTMITRPLSQVVLAVYLLVVGICGLIASVGVVAIVSSLLALVAGVLILAGK